MGRLSNQFVTKSDYPGEKRENRLGWSSCYSTIDADKYSMYLHPSISNSEASFKNKY